MKVSYSQLVQNRACAKQTAVYESLFGYEPVDVSLENLIAAKEKGLSVFFLERLLPEGARERHEQRKLLSLVEAFAEDGQTND